MLEFLSKNAFRGEDVLPRIEWVVFAKHILLIRAGASLNLLTFNLSISVTISLQGWLSLRSCCTILSGSCNLWESQSCQCVPAVYIWGTAALKEMGIKLCSWQLREQNKVPGFIIKRKFVIPNLDISGLPFKEIVLVFECIGCQQS